MNGSMLNNDDVVIYGPIYVKSTMRITDSYKTDIYEHIHITPQQIFRTAFVVVKNKFSTFPNLTY